MTDRKILEYNNLRRSKEYIQELKGWVEDNIHGDLDIRSFPQNQEGDIVLITCTRGFYIPYIDFGHHVSIKEVRAQKKLELTVAKVLGDSGINYYDPLENDLKLMCIDSKIRYLSAVDAGGNYIFLPHPKTFIDFKGLIPFLPGIIGIESHKKKAKEIHKVRNILVKRYKSW